MTSEPEWGPWIEHDGKGCPCVGQYVNAVHCTGFENYTVAGSDPEFMKTKFPHGSWNWGNSPYASRIIRYRIRKSRAMKLLQSIVENPPKQLIKEDA